MAGSRLAQRAAASRAAHHDSLAVALAFNAAIPFITPDTPWLSDVPVVFAIMLAVSVHDGRLTWPEREFVKQLGEKLYGSKQQPREVGRG